MIYKKRIFSSQKQTENIQFKNFNISKHTFTISAGKFFRIDILFFPILISSVIGGYFKEFILAYISAIIHECAHIYTAKKLDIKISRMEIHPFGVSARLASDITKNPIKEILIAVSGPISNLLPILSVLIIKFTVLTFLDKIDPSIGNTTAFYNFILLGANLITKYNQTINYLVYCNLGIAAINLLPVLPLDGGRILKGILSCFTGSVTAYQTTIKISRFPIALILGLSVFGLLTLKFNFSLILISAFMLSSLSNEQKNISSYAINQVLHSSENFNNTPKKSSVLLADLSTPARFIIRYLSHNRGHIVHVTDKKGKIIKTLSDRQILSAMSEKGIRITLKDII